MNENIKTIIFTSAIALLVNIFAILVEHFVIVPLREIQKRKQGLQVPRAEKPAIFTRERLEGGFRNIGRSSFYWIIFLVIIILFVFLEQYYSHFVFWLSGRGIDFLKLNFPEFVSEEDTIFSLNFIGYISVLLGFFLPIVLLRVWEQFDSIDRAFDREADSIAILYEDVMLLGNNHIEFKMEALKVLHSYTVHIIRNYKSEHQSLSLRKAGNAILSHARKRFDYFVSFVQENETDAILSELLSQLNQLIDSRGDRIGLSRMRLFQSLKLILIITSIVWITPFYTVNMHIGIFSYLLIITVTFLVIFILTIIDDLDDPFNGTWIVFIDSWVELRYAIEATLVDLRREPQLPRKKPSQRVRKNARQITK